MKDKNHLPEVSIVVSCFNQGKYLGESLRSVLNQTYQHWECIIINDGSTDVTEKIAKQFLEKDFRFKYKYQENEGVASARNLGIKDAKGTYILPLDADDLITETYIELAVIAFKSFENLKIVYCKAKKFGAINENWDLPEFNLRTMLKGNIIFSCALFKRNDWDNVDGYDINFKKGYEDWDFWICLLKTGGAVYQIPEVCFLYRINPDSRNHTLTEEDIEEINRYTTVKHIDLYVKTFGSYSSLLYKIDIKDEQLNSQNKLKSEVSNFIRDLKKKFFKMFLPEGK